jgi:polyribonucleotide nucleotidyltransferase
MKPIIVSKEVNGRKLSIETGRIAKQAGGSALVQYGDSVVLVAACSADPRAGIDFFPLTVDYVEKNYAGGKIPGGFFKREGKQSEKETLTSRLIDRPCRPLFPEGYFNEVQIIATVVSSDGENDPDILAVNGASTALTLSDVPFEGPIGCVRVGRIGGKLVINPKNSELAKSDMNYVVAGSRDAVVMVEGGSQEVPESEILEAIFFAHQELQVIIDMQLELQKQVGKEKVKFVPAETDKALTQKVATFSKPLIAEGIRTAEKKLRGEKLKAAKKAAIEKFVDAEAENAAEQEKAVGKAFEDTLYTDVRKMITDEGKRIDGRDTRTVRPITVEVGLLPRTHGSALFTRGETQGLVVTTLGTMEEAQMLDNLVGEATKTFMLHYNFPPFSVGEVKPVRGPGRREIGHGALAERAVKMVMPSEKDFPYVVRVVSEITESNGSSSMASVCGASLSLMDAGVKIKAPVAGVAMGLIKEGDKYAVLTDILGDEDHLGDMDFKVCGTEKGVTAVQIDIKIKGLNKEIMGKALEQAREGRLHILGKMNEVINTSRAKLNEYAPRIENFKISSEKIRDVIGPGGKVIRSLQEMYGVKISVTDDGTVSIASNDPTKMEAAIKAVKSITAEAEVGKLYQGIVKRIEPYGAFIEVLPNTDGLCHISELAEGRVEEVEDEVRLGEQVWVKVIGLDRGKIKLSRKSALQDMKAQGLTA